MSKILGGLRGKTQLVQLPDRRTTDLRIHEDTSQNRRNRSGTHQAVGSRKDVGWTEKRETRILTVRRKAVRPMTTNVVESSGERGGNRTCNLLIKSPNCLYPLRDI
jgi:hypothetical protein